MMKGVIGSTELEFDSPVGNLNCTRVGVNTSASKALSMESLRVVESQVRTITLFKLTVARGRIVIVAGSNSISVGMITAMSPFWYNGFVVKN